MTPAKLDVFVAFFCYGGNGGIGMQLPEITVWWAKVAAEMLKDERIGRVEVMRFGDVPLTMERNRAVRVAKDRGFDVILMIDSDNVPDLYLGSKPWVKPFWKTSFEFLYERRMRGLPSAICAPYCGPPPHPIKGGMENVYVFYGEDAETDAADPCIKFTAYSRDQAAQMRGIQEVAAGPTGCIVYTLDAFDLMGIHKQTQDDILKKCISGEITIERAKRLLNMQSWFFYEYTNMECTAKASTEDVTNTREIQLGGMLKYKQPVVFCNWDAWAGHYKPKCVGMPEPIYVEAINDNYREAVERNISVRDTIEDLDCVDDLEGVRVLREDEEIPADVQKLLDELANDDSLQEKPCSIQVTKRMIGSHVVNSVGHMTPGVELQALTDIVGMVVDSRPKQELRIVEVGSWVGESALALHNGLGPAGGVIYCIDKWEGTPTDKTGEWADEYGHEKLFEAFKENIGDLLDKDIKAIKGDSIHVATSMEPQGLDIVFLDAGHDYEAIKADIQAWLPHISHTGVLCGHDYSEVFPGVVNAVNEFCDEVGIKPNRIDDTCIWIVLMSQYLDAKKKMAAKKTRKKKEPKPQEYVADESTAPVL